MRDFNDRARPPPDHQKELVRLITGLAAKHSAWQVFGDFVEMAAISISNSVDVNQSEQREARYKEIVKRYKHEELQHFPQMFSELTLALEEGFSDALGRTFYDLELHGKYAGQYFTPYPVAQMMAKMTLGDKAELEAKIAERGFLTAMEPAVGSGVMVIALAEEMKNVGINFQTHLHVTAVDIDAKCVHMAYVQLALLYIPAVIVHGNSLSLEEFGHWYTPAHVIDGWSRKLRKASEGEHPIDRVPAPPASPPSLSRDDDPPTPSQLTLF